MSYKQKFDYDRFGNLYRKNLSNPTTGQQSPLLYTPIEDADISKSTNRFTSNTQYDDAGNVIQDTKYRNMNFSYDANGRMFKTSSTISSGQSNAVYDASGQRVAQQIDGMWQFFIYDVGGKKVAEYGGAQAQDEGGIRYVFTDWQGSTRAITGEAGQVQARMDYTAFGEEINANVGMRTTVQGFNAPNKLDEKYAQTERDKATGLDHTWFRKLENQGGRWTSPDPYNGSINLGNPQSFNRYSYVNNQPTNFIDPSGLNEEELTIRITTSIRGDAYNSFARFLWFVMFGGGGSRSGGGEPSGRGSGGGGTGNSPNPPEDKTDCEKFVDIVRQIAQNAANAKDFMQQMINRFIGRNLDTSKNSFNRAANIGNSDFGASGFKSQFQDDSNQVRHFTGGLWAGYLYGSLAGNFGMNSNEDNSLGTGRGVVGSGLGILPSLFPTSGKGGSEADIALNSVSTILGANLHPTDAIYNAKTGMITTPANLGYKGLADAIRKNVCK